MAWITKVRYTIISLFLYIIYFLCFLSFIKFLFKNNCILLYYIVLNCISTSTVTLNTTSPKVEGNISKLLFVIDGMTCGSCVSMVEHTIKEVNSFLEFIYFYKIN